MDPMELLKLLGIVIVVVGFACKLDSILVIMVAAVVTALVAGMDPVSFLETMGSSFVSNRSMCVFIMTFVITGTLERNGLKQAAAALMNKFKGATAGMVLAAYGAFAFGLGLLSRFLMGPMFPPLELLLQAGGPVRAAALGFQIITVAVLVVGGLAVVGGLIAAAVLYRRRPGGKK